jgi:class 3 adenylate cyclase
LAEFASVVDAVRCAVEIQRGMVDREPDQKLGLAEELNSREMLARRALELADKDRRRSNRRLAVRRRNASLRPATSHAARRPRLHAGRSAQGWLGKMTATRRLAAILAADVAGYSRLMGADEEGTHGRLKEHLSELVEPRIREHRGRTVKNTGAAEASRLKVLLAPYPSDEMTCWPVSPRVGNVKNNDPNLIEPISAQ